MRKLLIAALFSLAAMPIAAAEATSRSLDCNIPYASFGGEHVVVKDFTEMLEVLSLQAEGGNYCAQFDLGMMYLDGVGADKSVEQALSWLKQAAEAGHADAQHTLGLMHIHGVNVEHDHEAALEWFYKAGLSYLAWDNRRLALREMDYIARERPGHPFIQKLREAVHEHWLKAQRMSAN